MVQCLADLWCSMIGSNGIAILRAFFDAQPNLWDSDEECVGLAKYYLEGLCFLYKDSEHKNKKVYDTK